MRGRPTFKRNVPTRFSSSGGWSIQKSQDIETRQNDQKDSFGREWNMAKSQFLGYSSEKCELNQQAFAIWPKSTQTKKYKKMLRSPIHPGGLKHNAEK